MLIRRASVFGAELTVRVQGPEESAPTFPYGPWTQSCKVPD